MGEAQEQSQSHVAEIEIEEGEIVEVAATTGDGSGGVSAPVPAPAPAPAPASMEHPLENSWTFWFQNPNGKSKQAEWGTSLRSVFTFNTVEDFWRLYNNILPPSKLVAGSDFHCFKEGIEPKWEDPKCANGGKWTILPTKTQSRIDAFWLNTLLAMIGEQFDDGDEICGAVISVRARQEKIALWTKNAANESVQINIGRQWKDFLDYNEKIGYVFHDDSKKLEKLAKNRYNV